MKVLGSLSFVPDARVLTATSTLNPTPTRTPTLTLTPIPRSDSLHRHINHRVTPRS
ncbi:hypothetical protein F443_21625 [Phytophthora nicotianae P1569]|uniref:Uncharacterized protein n=1 Tax=Phytophthora nicotianae P1569 TaxID=1317065 RepID=V9DX42_PHYNI|nr:hypothetical protein F443_21625 [Phytophthora nicotianae P1569]